MKELIRNILRENIQQADKYYFNNKKLSPKVREIILKITNGDPYTKLITDIYFDTLYRNHDMGNWALSHIDDKHVATEHPESDILGIEDLRKIKGIHQELKNYNKNVFPIAGYNINGVQDIPKFTQALKERKSIIDKLSTLPSVATRNLKNDIRLERTPYQLQEYRSSLEYFLALYSQLGNREPELRKNIENKMFKGDSSLADWTEFAEEKENLLGGGSFTKKEVKEMVNDSYDLEIVYSKGDIMIVEVSGANGIKEIGCNSLWCFTYAGKHGNQGDWYTYSTRDLAYVIIDFSEEPDSPYFMHVLIKPIPEIYNDEEAQSTLFNMANQEVYDVSSTIEHFLPLEKAKKIMNFGIEPEKKPKEKKKKPKYVDPNQLSFQFETKLLIKKLIKEELKNYELDSMLNDIKLTNCDCCKYFDMESLEQYGALEKPLYYLINKREINTLEYISPKQYLYNIARGFGLTYDDAMGSAYNDEKAKKYAEMMKNGSKAPIGYYTDGKEGQEGRHRAAAAMILGCQQIPVVKMEKDIGNNYVKNIVSELKGLTFEEVNEIYKNNGYQGITALDWRELQNYIEFRL